MSIEIYEVHYEGTSKTHDAIEKYKWRDSTKSGQITGKPEMVKYIDGGGSAVVGQGASQVPVHTVHPTDGRKPFCQTKSDGQWSNNLLSLPTF